MLCKQNEFQLSLGTMGAERQISPLIWHFGWHGKGNGFVWLTLTQSTPISEQRIMSSYLRRKALS